MTSLAPCFGQETDQSRPDSPVVSRPPEIQCLCPFCGAFHTGIGKPCSHCEMEDTTAARDSARQRVGQWFVLQPNSPPSAPMDFESLLALVGRQVVISRTVVRGPTTGQLWRLASKVRGLSRAFGHCYACGGDVDTDETVCPHCDRVQTLQEHTEAVVPSTSETQERQALLNEPKITVHSIAGHIDVNEDPIAAARPVVAERFEHRIPKDDLLTPRDLAKAFQLEFGIPEQSDRYLLPSSHVVRQLKVGLTSVAALAVAFALVWPLINVVPQWGNANPVKSSASISAEMSPVVLPKNPEVTDARLASDVTYVSPPIVRTAKPVDPVLAPIAETASGPAPEDDPTVLWNAGIAAESAHDYTGAVAAYERIESLSSTAWPAQLETRLTLARKELKGEVR